MGAAGEEGPRTLVSLLGPATATVGDQAVSIGGPRQRAVLALLALKAGRSVRSTELIDTLWDNDPPPAAANTVQVYVSRLKRALGAGENSSPVRSAGGAYRLDLPVDAVDVLRFEALTAAGNAQLAAGQAATAAATLRAALDLWRGEPLPDLVGLADARIAGLVSLRQTALADRIDADLAQGRFTTLVPELERLVGEFPLDERFVVQLMSALFGTGRQADALAAYTAARARLGGELGVDPGPQLRAQYERVLRQELPPPAGILGADVVRRPAPPTLPGDEFVGRAAELAQVLELLRRDDVRLVTLLGPGGAGKTRLADEVVDRLVRAGVRIAGPVPLVTVGRVEDVVPEVGRALGADPDWAGESPLEIAARALAGCDVLVLDNLEQIDEVGSAVALLLERFPGLTVLTTSRHALGLRAEWSVPLGSLPVPPEGVSGPLAALGSEAVQLFRDRARRVLPDFEVRPDNATAVVELCRRLDGLPLALELAAARVRMLPPAEILARLDGTLAVLANGSAERPERHRSMWVTIDWSVRLLDAPERRVFAQLSVFSGGWSVAAAESVCGADVLDILHRLLERSLLVADGSGRMAMLETIRQYAAELLAQDEAARREARLRHARHYAELAEELGPLAFFQRLTNDEPGRRLTAESANLQAALEFSRDEGEEELLGRLVAGLIDHWYASGRSREFDEWVRAARSATLPTRDRVRLLLSLSNLHIAAGLPREAAALTEQAEVASRDLDDELLRVRSLSCRGMALRYCGQVDEALELAQAARALVMEPDAWHYVPRLRLEEAELLQLLDRSEEAVRLFHETLEASVRDGDAENHFYALNDLAVVAVESGNVDAAVAHTDEALPLARATGDVPLLVDALSVAGAVALVAGEPGVAAERLADAVGHALAFGQLITLAGNVGLLGAARLAAGDAETAARLLGASRAWQEERGINTEYRLVERLVDEALAALPASGLSEPRRAAERARGARTRFGSLRGIAALDPALRVT